MRSSEPRNANRENEQAQGNPLPAIAMLECANRTMIFAIFAQTPCEGWRVAFGVVSEVRTQDYENFIWQSHKYGSVQKTISA
jgi:hypothetical protein